jgi:hypothetical protein
MELIEVAWKVVRISVFGSVDDEWKSFKVTVLRISQEACGLITVEAGR